MKHSFLLAGLAAASLSFYACGSSSPSDTEDDILSSAKEKDTSSSSVVEDLSSSSVAKDLPAGARVATLDDIERNMELSDFFGTKAYLAVGTKRGLFSIWVPDTAWIAAPSDFKDGVLDFERASIAAIDVKGVVDEMNALVKKDAGRTIQFIVNEDDQLQYSLDGKTFKDVKTATVKVASGVISNGDSLLAKTLDCKDSSGAKAVYSFYEGRYIVEEGEGESKTWSAGYYDIHRSKLLMRPIFYPASVYALNTVTVSDKYDLTFSNGRALTCSVEKLDYKKVAVKDLAQEWDASVDGYDWTFDLRDDMSFELTAYKQLDGAELKKGIWDVYGNVLLLKVSGCMGGKCTTAVKGEVTELDPQKGFKYGHSDPDSPAIPKAWDVPVYE